MALLTAEEKEELKKGGIYVREKCDECGKPILSPVTYIKKGRTLCAKCAKGQDLVLTQTKEDNEMATKKAKEKQAKKDAPAKTSKIAGHLVAGTAIADLYLFLEDEKKHPLKDVLKAIAKHKADKMGRLRQLQRYGKAYGWAVTIDDDAETVQMKVGAKAAAAQAAVAKAEVKADAGKGKPAKSAKKAEAEEADSSAPGAVVSKQQKMIQKLVRRVLKDGTDWTKSKVIEKLKEDHELDGTRVQEALKEEIKLGGIVVKDGILSLV